MDKNPVAVPHAARGETSRRRLDPGVKFRPCPGGVAPDQRGPAGEPPRRLGQQMREIGGRYQRPTGQRNGSRIDT
jgi:hypothetical protein